MCIASKYVAEETTQGQVRWKNSLPVIWKIFMKITVFEREFYFLLTTCCKTTILYKLALLAVRKKFYHGDKNVSMSHELREVSLRIVPSACAI